MSWRCLLCRTPKRRSVISMHTALPPARNIDRQQGASCLEACYGVLLILLLVSTLITTVMVWRRYGIQRQVEWRKWVYRSVGPPPSPETTTGQSLVQQGQENDERKEEEESQTRTSMTPPSISSFFGPGRPVYDQTFCFVIGAEGTGSTWISKMIPSDHKPPFSPYQGLTARFHQLWSSGPIGDVLAAQKDLARNLKNLVPTQARLSVLHVSAPDWDAHHYPDIHSSLWSTFYTARLTLRIIVMVRDPAQAAHSNHRRKWKHLRSPNGKHQDIVHSARSTEMHMTLLSQQVQSLAHPHDVLVVNYHKVMIQPTHEAQRISRYLGLQQGKSDQLVKRLVASRRAPSNYTNLLGSEEAKYLDTFFDSERRKKWRYLWSRADENIVA